MITLLLALIGYVTLFTLAAFHKSADLDTVLTALDAVKDDQFSIKDEYLYVGELNQIAAVYASGEKIRQAKISAPSLLRMFPYYVRPYLGANNLSFPPPIDWRLLNPLPLVESEGVYVECKSETGDSTSYDYVVGILFSDGPLEAVKEIDYPARFTTTGTPVADAWTTLVIDLDDSLPAGRYSVVGADIVSGSGHLFRLLPIGGGWRPGGFPHWRESTCIPQQRHGGMGVWCEFEHNQIPSLEVFQTGADEPSEGVLDLVQIREGR